MHIAIDVREACRTKRTGKGQWTRAFVSSLLDRDLEITLCTDSSLPLEWKEKQLQHANRIHVVYFASGIMWHLRMARFLLSSHTIHYYVSPLSFIVPYLVSKRMRTIPVIHDLIAFQDATHERKAAFIERWTLPKVIRSAASICTVSESTKHDLLSRFSFINPNKVHAILAAAIEKNIPTHHSDGKTILSIGTLCPRKNQRRLIEAYAQLPHDLRAQYQLVLIGGRGWQDDDIVKRAQEVAGVQWLGFASAEEVQKRFSTAHIFAYPSLYEGFGLPVLDAMHLGIPVLCSHRGSLAEVVGDAAFLVHPESIDSIADGLTQLLTDTALYTRLSENGVRRALLFSWDRTVDIFLDAVQNIPA